MTINFVIVQVAPGGPVDQFIARMQGHGGMDVTSRITNTSSRCRTVPAPLIKQDVPEVPKALTLNCYGDRAPLWF